MGGGDYELGLSHLRQEPVASCCVQGNEPVVS